MKLLESDGSHSSFTLQLSDNSKLHVSSGLIASCKDDGCNSAIRHLMNQKLLVIFIILFVLFRVQLLS